MIDRKKFETLSQVNGEHCISIFIPTHRAGNEQEDRIRFKNALSEVKTKLVNNSLSSEAADRLLKEASSKIDDVDFWQHQSDGLAVFIYDEKTYFYSLPINFSSSTYIGNRLYLKPVIPVLTGNARFFLLAVSLDSVRMFEGDKYSITEIETGGVMPKNFQDLMKYYDGEEQLQYRKGQGFHDQSVYHGHGSGQDVEEIRRQEYMRLISKGLMDLMCDDDKDPLILATVEENFALYRQVNEYPHLHPEFIAGNPEHDDPVLLHEKAWELMRPLVQSDLTRDQEAFEPALAQDKASFSVHNIVPAALTGQVETLFVAHNDEVWGTYDEKDHRIIIHEKRKEDSQPLLNQAAIQTLQNGGTVYVLPRTDLPRPTGSVNAIYRYATVPV